MAQTSVQQRIEPPISAGDLVETEPSAVITPTPAQAVQAESSTDSLPKQDTVARWLPTLARWGLVLLALYAIGWLLWSARPALTPFIIGLVLAYLLMPIVNRLDHKMPRWLAILVVYVGGLGLTILAFAYIIPPLINQIQQLIENIPSIDELQQTGNNLLQQYRDIVPPSIQEPIDNGVRSALSRAQSNVSTYVQGVGGFVLDQVIQVLNTVTFLIGFLIIPIWLFYVLNDKDEGSAFIDRVLHPRLRADFWNVWGIINQVLSNYVRGQLLLGLAVGVMVGVGLLILQLIGFDMRYILLLSLVAGVTELIPILGPVLGAIPGILLGLFISPATGVAVLIVYVIVQQIENNFLVPRIIGESIGIHPAILTVILIAMGHVFGLLGIILAAPVAAIGRDLFMYAYRRLDGFTPARARAALGEPEKASATGAALPQQS